MLATVPGHLRQRLAYICAVAALMLACACAPFAASALGAEGNAFNELTEGSGEESTTPAKTTGTSSTSSSSSGSSTTTILILGLGAAVVLLGGIAFVIVRDARRVAPASDGMATSGRSGHDPAAELRRRRAKAKAARRQRKRNR
jgi:hypothetical protein